MKNSVGKKNVAGFALVEVLVAITLLSVVLMSLTAFTVSMMRANAKNKDSMVAQELSREGLEIVRSIRDTNWLNHRYWLDGLCTPVSDSVCEFGVDLDTVGKTFTVSQEPTSIDDVYTRTITLSFLQANCDDEACIDSTVTSDQPVRVGVVSTVSWNDHGASKSLKLETELSDWNIYQ